MAVLSDETWKRHANPWSVWTRYAAFPVLVAAIWSRVWLGWGALVPVAIVVAWLIWNPRAFAPPASTRNWASKAVLGERVWVELKASEVPQSHRLATRIANAFAGVGTLALAWGLFALDSGVTILAMLLVIVAKIWFVDRMVWLFEDMKDTKPEYRSWLY